MQHDIVIIGGGSAGYAAARIARDGGADVAIVDHGPLAGLCILRGCMPSKAILRSADIIALIHRSHEFGIRTSWHQSILGDIIDRKDRLIREFADYRIHQLRDPGFTLYEERAYFLSSHKLRIGNKDVEANRFIIATGSITRDFVIPGLDEIDFITSDEALDLREQPTSMLVLGGGPVACELAQFFQRIGTRVTLLQRSTHILSSIDEDLAQPVQAQLCSEGMEVFTNTRLNSFERRNEVATLYFTHRDQPCNVSADVVLQAMGRRPNIDGLGLDAAGVNCKEGGITVDSEMRTNQPHIFAVGDVNGIHEIVHIAIQQGEVAGFNAAFPEQPAHRVDDRMKTQVTFTDPAVASVGLSEKECLQEKIPYLVASYPFADHGKSMCLGTLEGHVKLLCQPASGELLGAHIVGPEAGELIHELIAVMYYRGTVHDLARMPHYHPTLAEIVTYPAEELATQLT